MTKIAETPSAPDMPQEEAMRQNPSPKKIIRDLARNPQRVRELFDPIGSEREETLEEEDFQNKVEPEEEPDMPDIDE
jgi:hypothetical protein